MSQIDWDKWLLRSSYVAQLLMVILVAYGYFYTVVPIYQKEKLAEEVVEKERLLKDVTTKLELKQNELKVSIREYEKTRNLLSQELKQRKHELSQAILQSEKRKWLDFVNRLDFWASTIRAEMHIAYKMKHTDFEIYREKIGPSTSTALYTEHVLQDVVGSRSPYSILKLIIEDKAESFFKEYPATPEELQKYKQKALKVIEQNKNSLTSDLSLNEIGMLRERMPYLSSLFLSTRSFSSLDELEEVQAMHPAYPVSSLAKDASKIRKLIEMLTDED